MRLGRKAPWRVSPRLGDVGTSIGVWVWLRQSYGRVHQRAAGRTGAVKMTTMVQHTLFRRPTALVPLVHVPAPRRIAALGQMLAFLCVVWGAAGTAWAACSDPPNAGVDWSACEKVRLVLRGANLAGARLAGADLNGTDLQGANLSGADLTHASVDRARLSGADLSRTKLVQLNGYRANMTGAIMVDANLTKAEMSRANLASVDLTRADLRKAELQRTNLEGSKLDRANLTGAVLARTNFRKASLQGTHMMQARMFRTQFEGVNLSGVVGLTQAQLEASCGDAATRLPAGLTMPAAWPCGKDE